MASDMHVPERETDEDGHRLPWEVHEITVAHDGSLGFEGTNHYAKSGEYGHHFYWRLDSLSFKDAEFDSRRYDFRGAKITPIAKHLLLRLTAHWTREECSRVAGFRALVDTRYWFTVDSRTTGGLWSCGWCFGRTEDEAREAARAEMRLWKPAIARYLDTATIWLTAE